MTVTTDRTERRDEAMRICQQICDAYAAVAYSDVPEINYPDSTVYKNMRRALIASIRVAYNVTALKAERVYDVLIACREPIDWCVEYVRSHRESEHYTR